MQDTAFDKVMMGILATIVTAFAVGGGIGALFGLYALWMAGKLVFLAFGAAFYATIRWAWLPIYRKIREEF